MNGLSVAESHIMYHEGLPVGIDVHQGGILSMSILIVGCTLSTC